MRAKGHNPSSIAERQKRQFARFRIPARNSGPLPGHLGDVPERRNRHDRDMEHALSNFSANLADLVERSGQSAVGIEARHRIGSSGFLWKSGVIVTAAHAIRRDEDIPVILPGRNRATAQFAGRDPDKADIAILRVDGAEAPALSHSKALRAGEIVVAIGRHEPGVLAAMGIVSTAGGPWKTWRGGQLDALLRLDIGAYPRSSGSLVVDTQGGFAGMLTAGLTRTALWHFRRQPSIGSRRNYWNTAKSRRDILASVCKPFRFLLPSPGY